VINRMEDNKIGKIARDGKPHSRRPSGRPDVDVARNSLKLEKQAESLFQE